MVIYGLKTCDTCRKARKALPAADSRDVRGDGVPSEVLSAALAQFGEALINRKSTTWRGLDDGDRAKEPIALLQEHPTLMKRPLIVKGDQMFLGWGKDVQTSLLG